MELVSFASVHDGGVVLLSLLTFFALGNAFLHGHNILYGLGKYHDNNSNQMSQVANFVFVVTLMTGCTVLEVRQPLVYYSQH
jgi:hypothetical protein